jgi:hypothetical protein
MREEWANPVMEFLLPLEVGRDEKQFYFSDYILTTLLFKSTKTSFTCR